MTSETSKTSDLIIDWDLGKKLAGNRPELARDLLNLFIQSLPTELRAIKNAYDQFDIADLRQYVHKLHGAASYCGVPRLKKILALFDTELKQNQAKPASTYVEHLELEANNVIKAVTANYS